MANGSSDVYEKSTEKSLQNILEDIEFAVTERNLRIVHQLHIGQGIRARGYEDTPDYEVILYCDLTFARTMLELAPEMVNACPGRISVRQTGSSYIVSAVLWPEDHENPKMKQLMYDMNVLVREIVNYAALEWFEAYED